MNNQPLSHVDPLGLEWACVSVQGGDSGCQWYNDPGLGLGGGGPFGRRGPGHCIVENRNPNRGRGHIVSTVYHPGEGPRLEYVSDPPGRAGPPKARASASVA